MGKKCVGAEPTVRTSSNEKICTKPKKILDAKNLISETHFITVYLSITSNGKCILLQLTWNMLKWVEFEPNLG
jgi:hypothetical protein